MHSKTLLILYPGCAPFELYAVAELLNADFPIEIATPGGVAFRAGNGITHQPQLSIEEAEASRYRIVAVPGGDIEAVYQNDALYDFLEEANELENVVLGGICNGVWLLARAGVLRGHDCTHTCRPEYSAPDALLERSSPDFEASTYRDQDVVVSSGVVTAKPWAHVDFATTLAALTGVVDRGAAEQLSRYYRGHAPPTE